MRNTSGGSVGRSIFKAPELLRCTNQAQQQKKGLVRSVNIWTLLTILKLQFDDYSPQAKTFSPYLRVFTSKEDDEFAPFFLWLK